ncbi:thioredoxin-like protein AAED1 isoform X1 [Neophocaena asiaeorientalis asiaeorientalis]|uniref:Thioredoxin-like protein AAED1 isoform X1 n=1 Tax=Neophocaena asiaeorientalis asiaeorientalis TaxID=1706337 RepID=A0A341CTK3_NEOAA|nr:thioredoxin-like protein AAED1 isoform X1 [Neophocaena asiaeorientalis asiaeorientalis]
MQGAMAAPSVAPVTRQISGRAPPAPVPDPSGPESGQSLAAAVADLPVLDASGRRVLFGALFRERRAVVVFVRHFLCYICKEYVEDLAKIPKSFLQEANVTLIVIGQSSYHHIEPFCKLTGYSHEIYVDPEREIYKRLGMKRGEETTSSGQSPHIKSNILSGSIRSLWRAVTGPLFDFQGDPAQQGGTLILGPGNNIHFIHCDRNRLDHKPINSVLQLVGVQHVDFTSRPSVIHV